MKTPLRCIACAGLALLLGGGAAAQSSGGFQGAASDVDQRLERSLDELAKVREQIAREKIPLSKSVAALEDEVLALRQEQRQLLKLRDSRTIDLGSLRKRVESLEAQEEFVDSRLGEFVRDFEGRLDISELSRFQPLTSAAKLAEKNVNLEPEEKRTAQLAVVQAALQRVDDQLGGQTFPGQALSPDGVLTDGTFVAVGPTTYFSSPDGGVRGLVENQLNAADPVVVDLPGGLADGITRVVEGGQGLLPFDPTMGKAVRIEKARETLAEHLEDGGAVGYVILGLGAAAILLSLFKALEILRFEVASPGQVDAVLDALANGDHEAAARRAAEVPGVSGELLSTGIANLGEGRAILEELLFEKILKVRPVLERFLPFLAVTATAAPLLGLLGTVTGMIKTFQLITIFGSGDAKSLSAGISEALVTTELGLMVAIPTLILHGVMSRMAKNKLGALEQVSVGFVNGVDTLATRPPPPPPAPSMAPSFREPVKAT